MPQTILSVEHDAALRSVRNEILGGAGFEIIEARTGAEALKLASEQKPALILLPLELPESDGFVVCEQLKENPHTATIPVLHVSKHGESLHDYPASLESGAEGYLPEPISPETLIATIHALIRAKAAACKRAEMSLRDSQRIYRAIGESIDYGVWICDADGRNTYVSESFLKLVGLTQEKCSSFGWGDVLHPDDAARTIAAWKECVRREGRWDIEHRFRGIDGTWHPVLARGVPVRDDEGRIACWAGINLDISALKRIEESLRDSEMRERVRAAELEAVMDAAPVAIFITQDPECQQMSGNRMAYTLLHAQPGSNLSKSAASSEGLTSCRFMKNGIEIPPRDLPIQRAAFTGRAVRNYEIDVVFENGTSINLLGDAVPMLDEIGRVRGAVGVLMDITEHKRAEQRFRQAQKLESLGLMAGGIAHDFNNLLVGVIGNASLAHSFLASDDPAATLMEKVVKTGEKAAHLTRQMLAYAGKGSFVVERVDLSDIVSEMSELVHPSISKKITLHLDLNPDLPSIEADRSQLQQVVMNLVLNASEAIGTNPGRVSLRTGIQDVDDHYIKSQRDLIGADLREGRYVYLQVSDTGCGMDEMTKARVFDPFFSTKFTGRGLGLAAVSGILRGHRGAVKVVTTQGEGSCFTVLFPAAEERGVVSGGIARTGAHRGTETILFVDDEEYVRQIAQRSLELFGHRVLLAESALAAIDTLKRHPGDIALVVLDLSMPGMSGGEALPELRKIRPGVKVVVSSGFSEVETMISLRGQQISGFIQKPYTAASLAEQVNAVLG